MKNYLEYVGACKFVIIDIYPNKKRIRLSRETPYKFERSDNLSDKAIKYYTSLRSEGVVLHIDSSVNTMATEEEVSATEVLIKDAEIQNTHESDEVSTGVEDSTKISDDDHTIESHEDDKSDKESEDTEEVASVTKDISDEVIPDCCSIDIEDLGATREEMIEFIDMNYQSDEELRALGKDAGIKRISSNIGRETLINKIIDTNPEYIVNLIKNQ